MPTYIFQHPLTGDIKEITQRISDSHEYADESGLKWSRVFTVPHTSIPNMTRIDAGSEQDFANKTQNTGGTCGDLFDLSRELSEKRKSQSSDGKDPVEQQFFKKYSKERKGMKHQNDTPQSRNSPNSDGVIEI
jgi:hypothetical protein|tara:strand:+ start:9365 stop:9763 length:399 start_codon:yes stop_codon:yes gene_type:complete